MLNDPLLTNQFYKCYYKPPNLNLTTNQYSAIAEPTTVAAKRIHFQYSIGQYMFIITIISQKYYIILVQLKFATWSVKLFSVATSEIGLVISDFKVCSVL